MISQSAAFQHSSSVLFLPAKLLAKLLVLVLIAFNFLVIFLAKIFKFPYFFHLFLLIPPYFCPKENKEIQFSIH
jgi:hypothetical protein